MASSSYRTQSRDTTEEVERLLFDRWRRMSVIEKADLIGSLSRSLRRTALAGLRHRFPEASEDELVLRGASLRLGEETARRVFAHPARRSIR